MTSLLASATLFFPEARTPFQDLRHISSPLNSLLLIPDSHVFGLHQVVSRFEWGHAKGQVHTFPSTYGGPESSESSIYTKIYMFLRFVKAIFGPDY